MPTPTPIYKILSAEDWQTASRLGHTQTALDEGDGYVHLSGIATVAETLRLYYAGQSGVRLLEFFAEDLGADITWEASRGGQMFPHLYGNLMVGAARRTWALTTDTNGDPQLPEDL